MNSIKVKCPGSLSNLVCGYDIFGMALQAPYDTIELRRTIDKNITIQHLDDYGLSTDPAKNIAGVALKAIVDHFKIEGGFEIIIDKKIKPGSGIGSSAASAAGIVFAANELLQLHLSKEQMIHFAMEGEVIASGSRHADNIAPLIHGGLTLIRDAATYDIIGIKVPPIHITVLHPQIEVKTSYAREILPKEIKLSDAVKQWANTAGLMAGFLQADYNLLRRSMTDYIVEPVRKRLIPLYDDVKSACMIAGALGGGISGSGPSMFMFSQTKEIAMEVESAMIKVYSNSGIEFKTYVTEVNNEGVSVQNDE